MRAVTQPYDCSSGRERESVKTLELNRLRWWVKNPMATPITYRNTGFGEEIG